MHAWTACLVDPGWRTCGRVSLLELARILAAFVGAIYPLGHSSSAALILYWHFPDGQELAYICFDPLHSGVPLRTTDRFL